MGPTELKGHTALVYGVAFSPDGKLLATAGFDNDVKLWDFGTAKEARTLKGHTGPVYSVSFNNDGTVLASSSQDATIRLWKVADGKQIGAEIKGHTGIVDSVAFSPDGKLLASGGADKSVRLWNPADGKEVKNLGAHANSVYSVAFSPDGKQLVSASADGTVKVWDVVGQKELKTLKPPDMPKTGVVIPPAAVTGALFTPDGKQVVSIGHDRFVRLFEVASGNEVKKLGPTEDDLYGVAFSRDGMMLATSGYAGHVKVWNLAEGKATFAKNLKPCAYCVTFTPDGKALVTGHDNSICYVTPVGP
jgi:WD40 repeat protein